MSYHRYENVNTTINPLNMKMIIRAEKNMYEYILVYGNELVNLGIEKGVGTFSLPTLLI